MLVEAADWVRLVIATSVGAYVWSNQSYLTPPPPVPPPRPDWPTVDSPAANSRVEAGTVTFEGRGPEGLVVEVMENGRVLAESKVENGRWSAFGKLYGEGPTSFFVRAVTDRDIQSRAVPVVVKGRVERTLTLTKPVEYEYLQKGRYMFKGTALPGDEVIVAYDREVKFKAVANSEGKWWKAYEFDRPARVGRIRVSSKAQSEVLEIVVQGPG